MPDHKKEKDLETTSTSKNVNNTHDTTVGHIYLSQHEESNMYQDTI